MRQALGIFLFALLILLAVETGHPGFYSIAAVAGLACLGNIIHDATDRIVRAINEKNVM